MTGYLFGGWIKKLASSFQDQDRKVVIFMDNCPAHPEIKILTNMNLIFFTTKHDICDSTDRPRCNTKSESPLPKTNRSSIHQIFG